MWQMFHTCNLNLPVETCSYEDCWGGLQGDFKIIQPLPNKFLVFIPASTEYREKKVVIAEKLKVCWIIM